MGVEGYTNVMGGGIRDMLHYRVKNFFIVDCSMYLCILLDPRPSLKWSTDAVDKLNQVILSVHDGMLNKLLSEPTFLQEMYN